MTLEPPQGWDSESAVNAALHAAFEAGGPPEAIAMVLHAAYNAGHAAGLSQGAAGGHAASIAEAYAAGADAERARVFAMMRADIKTATGLDWSPLEGRTLTWVFEQYKATAPTPNP